METNNTLDKKSHILDEDSITADAGLDPAQQSLADALRVSFRLLGAAIVVLLGFFLFSGAYSVGPNEVAVPLTMGAYSSDPTDRVRTTGTYLAAPFPLMEVIKVDTRPRTLSINDSFWYELTDRDSGKGRDQLRQSKSRPLNPTRDGSLLTGDFNIIHSRWDVEYRVSDPQEYLSNVSSMTLADRLVRCAAEQGIVHAIARVEADQALKGLANRELAMSLAQHGLDEMNTGLRIESMTLQSVAAPFSVVSAIDAVTTAESERAQAIVTAERTRARVLGELAGEAHEPLQLMLTRYDRAIEADNDRDAAEAQARLDASLSSLRTDDGKRIGGEVARIINEGRTYQAQVLETVKAQAMAFRDLLPDTDVRRRIVMNRLLEDAKQAIYTGDVETFYVAPGQIKLDLNRDPELARKRQEDKLKTTGVRGRQQQ
jgi:regulator of protease activity HflC (stomatin/prohibitin superfamily)